MKMLFSPLVLLALAAAAFGVAVLAADLGIAAWQFGPDYVRRLVLWQRPSPLDRQRFPIRAIAAPAVPSPLPQAPEGAAAVAEAFGRIGGAAWTGARLPETLAQAGTNTLLILRDGQLIYAAYLNGHGPRSPQNSFSVAKSITSLLVGAAIGDGLLPPPDSPAETLLPKVPGLRGSGVTLRHLLDMQSGFALGNRWRLGLLSRPWRAEQRMHFAPDLRAVAAAVRPEVGPGKRFLYDDRNAMLLGMALARASGETPSGFMERRLWRPMGAACPAEWILDSTAQGFEKMESGIAACAEDYLRIGARVLRGGVLADGTRLLPADWIAGLGQAATAPEGAPGYGLLWWSFANPAGPPDIFASGLFGQVLYVSRARGMVLLRTGDRTGELDWPALLHRLSQALSEGEPPAQSHAWPHAQPAAGEAG